MAAEIISPAKNHAAGIIRPRRKNAVTLTNRLARIQRGRGTDSCSGTSALTSTPVLISKSITHLASNPPTRMLPVRVHPNPRRRSPL